MWSLHHPQEHRGRWSDSADWRTSRRSPPTGRPSPSPWPSRTRACSGTSPGGPVWCSRGRHDRLQDRRRTAPVRSCSTTGSRATASRSPATTTTGATRPRSPRVVFDYIPDNQAALNAALAGEVDVLTGVRREPEGPGRGRRRVHAHPREVHRQGHPRVQPDSPARSPTSACGRRIRQAIDHEAFIDAAGPGETLYGPIPELDPGYEDLSDVAPYDPEAAKALLDDAGVEGPDADADDPELLLHDDPADPGVRPQRGRHHPQGRLGGLLHLAQRRLHQPRLRPELRAAHAKRATSRTGRTRPTTSPTTTPRCRTCTSRRSRPPTRTRPPICSSRPRASCPRTRPAIGSSTAPRSLAVGTNITGMPSTNVNERLNLAELAKSNG